MALGLSSEFCEFLEALYLIESSLFESEDVRRIILLDKSLDTILQGSKIDLLQEKASSQYNRYALLVRN